ncbi:MAG: DUF2163 domain-containing protein [Paracoccus sp. (in: a-proteobacteria)]|nr:DUF2163 domain-containing protein [Paracoccus sp. (in: a-proteobacteria)]
MSVTTIARAWAVARRDGVVLGFTDHDRVLEFAGLTFRPHAGLSAQAVVQGAGLSVDNTEVIGALSDGGLHEGDILAGLWDGAELRQWDVDWSAPGRHRLIFRGHLGEITRKGGAFRAELRGLSEPLNQPRGRVFHPRCDAVLGGDACGVDLARPGFTATARVTQADGAVIRLEGMAGYDDRWFEHGRMIFADGTAGHVKNDRARPDGRREVELWARPAVAPAAAEVVTLIAGCNKSSGMCQVKFMNFMNFRGFPHLPAEDWLLAPQAPRAARPRGFDGTNPEGWHEPV